MTSWNVLTGSVIRGTGRSLSGFYSLYLGGYNNAADSIGQSVLVPSWADRVAIYLNWYMASDDSVLLGVDSLWMTLGTPSGANVLLRGEVWNNGIRGTWITTRVGNANVVAYRGEWLPVTVTASTDGIWQTGWWVDDLAVVFACGDTVP